MPDGKTILVIGQSLFFLPRIDKEAVSLGYDVRLVARAPKFWELHEEGNVVMVLVDLEGDRETWVGVVRGLREPAVPPVRIVAFGPHTDAAALDLARELGCDAVLTKGEFNGTLKRIVETGSAQVRA